MRYAIIFIVSLLLVACAESEVKETDGAKAKAEVEKQVTDTEKKVDEAKKPEEKLAVVAGTTTATCKLGKDERTVELIKTEAGGCDVKYTKWGETSVVGSAISDMSFCEKVYDNIKANLESAKFECN